MNSLSGLLIEYLAIGSTSVVWILLLLLMGGVPIEDVNVGILTLLLPAVYVLGMMGDSLGHGVLLARKSKLKKALKGAAELEGSFSHEIYTRILLDYPGLAKDMSMRSSRDRVARGVLVNVPLIGLCAGAYAYRAFQIHVMILLSITGVVTLLATVLVYRMWLRFQANSYRQEAFAYHLLVERGEPGGRRGRTNPANAASRK